MTGFLFQNVLRPLRRTFFFASFLWPVLAHAEPFRPADDNEVIEQLPPSPVRSVDKTLDGDAPDPILAARLARAFVERNRRTGDSRLLGYAQGVLTPWWNLDDAPDPVLMMRAILRQAHHDFDGALLDLNRLLERSPDNGQAWLTKATVLRVQGHFTQARDACGKLDANRNEVVYSICSISMRGLGGRLASARKEFAALKTKIQRQPDNIAAWYYAERGDAEVRAGDTEAALSTYQYATRRFSEDLDLLAAYADLLLQEHKYGDVFAVIPSDTTVDALRLRRALAAKALQDPSFKEMDRRIRAGFKAARARGEALHIREEARYRLAMEDPIEKIIPLAVANWEVQREAWDARILIDCANRAGNSKLARPVEKWLRETGYQDVRLPPVARP